MEIETANLPFVQLKFVEWISAFREQTNTEATTGGVL